MPIILDHQLREYIPHNAIEFPITYFHDELVTLPDWAGPLHWHPDFEIATAEYGTFLYIGILILRLQRQNTEHWTIKLGNIISHWKRAIVYLLTEICYMG